MGIYFDAEITGLDAFYAKVNEFEHSSLSAGGNALVELAVKIVEVIKEHYVPVDVGGSGKGIFGVSPMVVRIKPALRQAEKKVHGGTLRDSVDCDHVARFTASGMEVTIFAGRPGSGAEAYAAIQHENLLYHHVVGQAKYIEVPLMLMAPPEMVPIITKNIKEAMTSAWG